MKRIILFFTFCLTLSGCMMGPNYKRTTLPAQEEYLNKSSWVNAQDSIVNLKWFSLFQDSTLIRLIRTGLRNNLDLKIAIARVEQSRALYGMSKADLFPALGYNVKAGPTNQSDLIGFGKVPTTWNYQVLGNVSWELDVWGKIRRSNRAALNQVLAANEAQHAIQSTLVSDIAGLYFQLRDLDNRIDIAKNTLKSRQEYYNKMKERFEGGDISELDLLQSEQQLREAQASIPSFERQLAITEHTLNVVLGQPTQSIERGYKNLDQPESPIIPTGLPSQLLTNRPDIRLAEYNYIAETERIGVAQALRLPSFSLTGFLGVASNDLSTITTSNAITTSLIGTALGPIFNFGKNLRRVESQKKATEIAFSQYQKSYLVALAEVENALVAIQTYRTELSARQQQYLAAQKNLALSKERYDAGYTSYLEVLIAESNMFNAGLATSAIKAQQLNATVTLYRALGGGWE